MNNEKMTLPLNLQFFAESGKPEATQEQQAEQQADVAGSETQGNGQETPDAENMDMDAKTESLMAEIARMKVNEQKMKKELDKALRETGEAKKALRAKQTAEELEDEAKREEKERHEAYVAELEEFKQKTLAKERYLMQGMTVEMAGRAAEAEVSGDMDALTDIQKQHTEATLKNARAEWQKSIPQPQYGMGDQSSMTKEDILAIKDDEERVLAIARNKHLFK